MAVLIDGISSTPFAYISLSVSLSLGSTHWPFSLSYNCTSPWSFCCRVILYYFHLSISPSILTLYLIPKRDAKTSCLHTPTMSRPIVDFSLNNLDLRNRLLGSAAKPSVSIFEDNAKPVHLASGKTIKLRRKPQVIQKTSSVEEDIQNEKSNYGFNIDGLYAILETQRLMKPTEAPKKSSYFENKPKESLWAEKWRPKNFFDFVGNESTNRKIMRWLKQWDRVVFHHNFQPITTEDTQLTSFTDPFGRPERKVLLITGPPGLGKTTVAHIIAQHAGYEVMEINASDERAGQRVKDKVNNSLTSMTFSGKPVCLIADEVDGGAEFGFIKVLMDIINDDMKTVKRFQASESSKFFKQKGKNRPKFLLRPIVCICNDAYVPALEKLRPHAEMITFQQASEQALIDRLKLICDQERLKLTHRQLQEIVHLTDFDIRSCVNLLQFGGGLNTSNDSRKKDCQMTWYGIVNEIFKKSAQKTKNEQFVELSSMVNVHSNLEKVIHGCFQAYPDVHYQDSGMSKPGMISDWLFFADRMAHSQFEAIGDLSYYLSQVALQFFNQFSDSGNRSSLKIKSDWEYFERRKQSQNSIKIIHSKLSPQLRSLTSEGEMPLQVLPYLESIIVPERKSTFQMKARDQLRIHNAVDAIQGFGLYLNRAKDNDYNDIYVTFPEFTSVTRFDPASVKRQQQRQTQVFPQLLKEMETMRTNKRKLSQMEGAPTQNNIDQLKDQYSKINEVEKNKKQRKTAKVWVKYHEGFSNAVRKPVKWSNLW